MVNTCTCGFFTVAGTGFTGRGKVCGFANHGLPIVFPKSTVCVLRFYFLSFELSIFHHFCTLALAEVGGAKEEDTILIALMSTIQMLFLLCFAITLFLILAKGTYTWKILGGVEV